MRILRFALATMASYVVLVVVTSQVRAVRAVTPWQDDPWNVVTTLAMASVPVGLVLAALLGTARAAALGCGLVVASAGTDLLATATLAHRSAWTGVTWVCVGLFAVVGLAALGVVLAARGAVDVRPRHLDLLERVLVGPSYGVRRHPVVWTVGAAELGAMALVGGMWWGEGASPWVIAPLFALVGGAGFSLVVVGAHRVLRLADVDPGHPAARRTCVGAAAGLVVAFAVHGAAGGVYAWMAVGALGGAVAAYWVRPPAASASRAPSSSPR